MKPGFSVSVVVRTCDRPMLLARALQSIGRQNYLPAEVVLVDVGAHEVAVGHSALSDVKGLNIKCLPGTRGLSRGAALNRGVSACSGEWFAVLDDDDTWDEDFLQRMVDRARPGVPIACQTEVVFEAVEDAAVRELSRRRFNGDFQSLDLVRLAGENQFTINALLCPHALWKKVDGYREDLEALEDWEFNLRLACETPIDVLPEALARYHMRTAEADAAHRNSARELHERVRAELREQWLRDDLRQGRFGLGALAMAGRQLKLHEEFPFRPTLAKLHAWWRRLRS